MKLPIVCWGEAEEVGALDESVPVDGLAEPDVLDPSPEVPSASPEEAADASDDVLPASELAAGAAGATGAAGTVDVAGVDATGPTPSCA
jgi:hypothetical protein